MRTREYLAYVKDFFEKKDIRVSDYAMRVFKSQKYLNRRSLQQMKKKEAKKNMEDVLEDILESYRERKEHSIRSIRLRDIDVRPVVRRVKERCNHPPVC